MTYGDDHTITTWIVTCLCGWQQHRTYDGSTTPLISHVCAGRPAKEPS